MTAKTLPAGQLLVDASVLIALADQDPHTDELVPVMRRSIITAINMGEVFYKLHQRAAMAPATVEHMFINILGIQVHPVDLATAHHFPELRRMDGVVRARSGARQALSLADMTCLAYARQHELPVLTGDRHWLSLIPHGVGVQIFDYRDCST